LLLCFDVSAVFFVGFGAEKRPRAEIFGTLRVAFSERGRFFNSKPDSVLKRLYYLV
jgi:hypothetical protein